MEDTGYGIAPDLQHLMVETSRRLSADRRGIEGTGIGLVVTKHIIERMGGEIGLKSTENGGSKFWLDVVTFGGGETPHNLENSHFAMGSPTISDISKNPVLRYIEDDRSNLELMQKVIEHFPNLEMLPALTGEDGLDLTFKNLPDVALVCICLPGVDGVRVLERHRKISKHPHRRLLPFSQQP